MDCVNGDGGESPPIPDTDDYKFMVRGGANFVAGSDVQSHSTEEEAKSTTQQTDSSSDNECVSWKLVNECIEEADRDYKRRHGLLQDGPLNPTAQILKRSLSENPSRPIEMHDILSPGSVTKRGGSCVNGRSGGIQDLTPTPRTRTPELKRRFEVPLGAVQDILPSRFKAQDMARRSKERVVSVRDILDPPRSTRDRGRSR